MIPLTNDIIELSIYADYLDDQGKYIEATHLREELQEIPMDDTEWCWRDPSRETFIVETFTHQVGIDYVVGTGDFVSDVGGVLSGDFIGDFRAYNQVGI